MTQVYSDEHSEQYSTYASIAHKVPQAMVWSVAGNLYHNGATQISVDSTLKLDPASKINAHLYQRFARRLSRETTAGQDPT